MYSPRLPNPPARRTGLLALLVILTASAPFRAAAQDPLIFDEKLYEAPDAALVNGQSYAGGSAIWEAQILGGNLMVSGGAFVRTVAALPLTGSATLTNRYFVPFNGGSWVARVVIRGTSTISNSSNNGVTLAIDGDAGTYGCRLLISRTNGNDDLNFGQDSTFSDLYAADLFASGQFLNREVRLTFVNHESTLSAFVDDLTPYGSPVTVMATSDPTSGTIKTARWERFRVILGSKFTGEVDNLQFYNIRPFVEPFNQPDLDPLAPSNLFAEPWDVLDATAPPGWRLIAGQLEWKAPGGAAPPLIAAESPRTGFTGDSWLFETTLTFGGSSNLAANRALIEAETAGGTILGLSIPRTAAAGRRLTAYRDAEANILGFSTDGSDLVPAVPYRVSVSYNQGELVATVSDRVLALGNVDVGLGGQIWRRIRFAGDAAHRYSADSVLFFNAGRGALSAGPEWAAYE